MTITVEELRRKYPEPTAMGRRGTRAGRYCVGGALCLELGVLSRTSLDELGAFPGGQLIDALLLANPRLDEGTALQITLSILEDNDAGNFDVAWAWLDKGLSA